MGLITLVHVLMTNRHHESPIMHFYAFTSEAKRSNCRTFVNGHVKQLKDLHL